MPCFGVKLKPVYFHSGPGDKAEGKMSDARIQPCGVMQDIGYRFSQAGRLKIPEIEDIRRGKENAPDQKQNYARPYAHFLSS